MSRRQPTGTPALVLLTRDSTEHTVHAYEHDPAVASYGLEAAAALGVDPARVLKTLLAEVDERPVVAIVPVKGSLDLKALAAAMAGKRARMLDAPTAERLTGYVVGGISPLAQRTSLPTVLDRGAASFETVFVSAGRRGRDVEVRPADLTRLTRALHAPISTT